MQRSRALRRLAASPAAALCAAMRRPQAVASAAASRPSASTAGLAFASLRWYADAGHGHGGVEEKRAGQYLLEKADVLQRVIEVVKNFEKVDAAKVTPESHFINDLGLDSLDVVEVVMALEQEFILDIPDHEAEKLQSVPEAVEYIAQNPMAK